MRVAIPIIAMLFLLSGCIEGRHPVTPKLMESHGVRTYNLPMEKTMQACEDALASLGYGIALRRPDLGLIETLPRNGSLSATSVGNQVRVNSESNGWRLELVRTEGGTKVYAYPRYWSNGTEITTFFHSDLKDQWPVFFSYVDRFAR